MSDPDLHRVEVNGVTLAYFERGERRTDSPTLLFVHATGFHGRIWDVLARELPDVHSIAIDQRGHGRSESVEVEHWQTFGEDVAAFVEALDLRDAIGVGHSAGAHALVQGAAMSGRFDRLLLLDPTIASRELYGANPMAIDSGEPGPFPKRRADFASAEEMMEKLQTKGGYPFFEPAVFRDYCTHGLVPREEGGMTLACRPEVEASVYRAAFTNGAIYDFVRSLDIPCARRSPRTRTRSTSRAPRPGPSWRTSFRRGGTCTGRTARTSCRCSIRSGWWG